MICHVRCNCDVHPRAKKGGTPAYPETANFPGQYPLNRRTYHAVLTVDLIGTDEKDEALLTLDGDKLEVDATAPLGLNLMWHRKGSQKR